MKTALMEFIEYLEGIKERDKIPSWVITTAKNHLAVEKQQIINAYHINPLESKYGNAGIKYYNETYGN